MHRSPFVLGLAAVFAGLTAVLLIGAVVGGQPIAAFAAAPLGVTSYVMFYHGSGRLERRARTGRAGRRSARGAAARGGFGAGPRSRRRARTRAGREARGGRRRARERPSRPESEPTPERARRTLGVDADAGADEIRAAYRERVKEVHPDRGGDEEAFKRVTAAYDRLSD